MRLKLITPIVRTLPLLFLQSLLPRAAAAGAPAGGTAFGGAYAPSADYVPPSDPAVLGKLAEWQDWKVGMLISWQASTQWGIDSWPLCPERYDWNKRRDWVSGTDSPFAKDDRAYKNAYEGLITTFNPTQFNPGKWAAAAADAGVKYVVAMSKHCDGFCMWDTKTTEYRSTAAQCPFHTDRRADILKELTTALHRQGLRVGMYASKADWSSPLYWSPDFPLHDRNANYDPRQHPELWKQYKDFTWRQIEELVTGYGPLDVLWLDDGWVQPGCNAQDIDMNGLAALARQHHPGLIVVDRTIKGPNENYVTPEGLIPPHYLPYPWETCMPLGNSWNYLPHDAFKSAGALVRNLCTIVARGGNYLIGIGPGPDGEFDPTVYARLKELGAWLKLNGEAIYATRPLAPYEHGDCVFTTRRDGTAYAIILAKDDNGTLPATVSIPAEVVADSASIALLGHGAVPPGETKDGLTTLVLPAAARARPPCAHAWVLKLAPKATP